ncbi:MAG: 1,6-anhydro-N-acetylmuramyl-L-alanine amidase [Olavius algarvensis Gamma 1 endosymbiont]|nr:MAG: 1,6-anhydro-N-acetylmuramyl-L-alanine amidase [Olavius algarvensis Gamma 1 endosymbiont]
MNRIRCAAFVSSPGREDLERAHDEVGMSRPDGWLSEARRRACPNWDERPPGVAVDLLVIHGISLPPGEFGGPWIHALFQNCLDPRAHPYFQDIACLRVSSHLLIRRDGELIQYVDLRKRAWHAGASSFEGRPACNDFAIGIELEGTDQIPYEEDQYRVLAQTTKNIQARFPAIGPGRIVGHGDIAPGRKTDPGAAFDWEYFRALVGTESRGQSTTPIMMY